MDKLCVIQADLDFAANVVRKMGCGAEHYDMIVGESAAFRIASQAELVDRVRKSLDRADDRLGGVAIERMEGDNLAVTLCTHFDDPYQPQDENGWSEAATDGCDETLKAIRKHYREHVEYTLSHTKGESK